LSRFQRRELDSTCLQFMLIMEYKDLENISPHRWKNDSLLKDGELGLNCLGCGFKRYFAHVIPAVDRIVAKLRKLPVEPRKRT